MPDELRDELKGKIAGVIADARNEDYDGCLTMDLDEAVDSVLSLIAPVLADAEKWKRFLAIQSCNDCPACPECPCDYTNCPAQKIEDALEGEGEKG